MPAKKQRNEMASRSKNIIQEKDEIKFLYLDDVRKNLIFLHKFSGVVASLRSFNCHDDEVIRFVNDCCAREFEDLIPITADGVCELGIFELARLMLDFLDGGQKNLLHRVLDSQYFCPEVISVF